MKHLELQKFQNSAFDEFTQKKFIEDQKIIMELSGRLQELQNEVNFMNDSKDFMDAESTCSGNPHVTSPPGLFPRHPPFEGMLRPLFSSQRQNEEPPNIWDTSGTSGNVFAHPSTSFFVSSVSSGIEFHLEENYRRTNPHVYCREKWKTRARLRSEMPVRTVSQKFSSLQWRRLFKELWGRPTTTADFGSGHIDPTLQDNVVITNNFFQYICHVEPCSEERIEVLSDSIECNRPSTNTPSLLYPESCSDGD